MVTEEIRNKAKVNSFYISITYVGLGTALLFIWAGNDYELIITLYSILALVTIPVTLISWGITYTEAERPVLLILGIQLIVFFIFWLIAYKYLIKRYDNEERLANEDRDES